MRKILVLLIFPLFALSFAQTEMWTWNCGTPTAESSADSVTFSGERDILLYRNQKAVLRRQVDSITFAAPAVLQLPIVQCVNLELGEMPDRCNGGIQSPLLTTDVTCNPYKSDGVTVALSWSDDGMAFGTNTNWFAIDLTAHPDTLIRAASVRVRMNRYQEGTHDHIFVKYAPDQEPQSVAVSSLVTSGEIIDLTPTSPTSYLWIARGSATTTLFSDLCLTLSKKGDDTEPVDPPTPVVIPTLSGLNLTQGVKVGEDIVPVVITADGSDVVFDLTPSELPDGLTAQTEGDKIFISGAPVTAGTYSIDVTATRGSLVSDPLTITLTVAPGEASVPVLKGRNTIQTITLGDAIQEISVWSTNADAESWTIDPATLPDGITMTQTGNTLYFNGRPTTIGYNSFSVVANAGLQSSDALPVSVLVKTDQAPVLTSSNVTQTIEAGSAIRSISITSDIDAEFAITNLPSGLSQSVSGKTLTITGNISQTGTYTFDVTAEADGLTSTPVTVNIEVLKPKAAPVLTFETSSDVSVIVNRTMPVVTFISDSVLSHTEIEATGLPTGIILTEQGGNRFSLSGTPLFPGNYVYSITATKNGLTSIPITGTIVVFEPQAPVVTVTPSTQSVTSGTPITPIVFTSDSSDVSFEVSTLPSGLSSTNDGKTLTVSGTATATGVSSISVTATKNGKTSTASVSTLTVTAKPVVAPVLSIASGSLTQTVKETNAISNVVIESDSLVTLTATGLPSGISISPVTASHTFTLSGVPSSVGVHNVSLSATKNGKTSNVLTGTITVMALAAPVVTVTPSTQSVTSGTPITPIVFTSDSSDVSFEVSTLPSGLSSTNDGKTLTVSGTATATGVSSISVTATKNGKTSTASVSTLTVTEPLLPLTIIVTGGSATQTVGVGEILTTITFTASESSALLYISQDNNISGITIGDPNIDNTSSISGTPAATGVINYTVHAETTDGRTAQLSGKITVANATGPVLSVEPIGEQPPAAELLNQTVTAGSSIENINIRSDIPATMTVTGLPVGVQGLQSSTSETVMTIQGKPTVSGIFNFTVSAVGKENGMSSQNVIQGTIKVIGAPVLTIKTGGETTSNLNQTVEKGDAISTIVISSDVSAIWSATGLADAGLSAETSADYKTYTITGTPSSIMNYPISVTAKTSNLETTVSGTITVKAKTPTVKTKTYTVGSVSFKTVEIEGGTFQMGSSGTGIPLEESPIHSVTVSDFEMGQTEVTQALWVAVLGETNKPKWNANYGMGDAYPVYNVNYDRIVNEFLPALNASLHTSGQLAADKQFTLPTEAEWEYAARGGKNSAGYTYSGGNNLNDVAYYTDNSTSSGRKAHWPVAGKAANESGLYDMSGNVSEWCYDWYGNYSSTSQTNPIGVAKGTNGNQNGNKVLRGGNSSSSATECRVSARKATSHSSISVTHYGFRLVLDGITKSQSDLNE